MRTLIKFELKKMMNGRIIWILLLVFAAFVALDFMTTTFGYTIYDANLNKLTGLSAIQYDRDQQNQYAGQYSDEEAQNIADKDFGIFDMPMPENQIDEDEDPANHPPLSDEFYWKYARPHETVWYGAMRQNTFDDIIFPTLKSGDLTNLYYSSMLRFAVFNINLFPSPGEDNLEAPRLLSMYEKVELPLTIEFFTGIKELVNSLVSILLFPGIAILIICLSPVFSKEYSTNSAPIVLTTKLGKTKLIKSKLIAAYLFASGLFLATSLIYAGFYLSCWGTSGMAASIQINPYFNASPYNFKMWQLLLAILGMGYLGFLFITSVALLISAKAKNAYTALIPLAVITYLPLIDITRVSGSLQKALLLFPANLVEAAELFKFPIFYNIGGLLIDRAVLSVIISVVAVIALTVLAARAFRKHQVSN